MTNARKLAGKIADELMTNGAGDKAQRLVMELKDGRDAGGWCRNAVIIVVERILEANGNNAPRT